MSGSVGGEGLNQPATSGEGYGQTDVGSGDAVLAIPAGVESGSYVVRALESNSGPLWFGWDEDVDDSTGFPLYPSNSLSADIDNSSQPLYVYSAAGGDTLAYIASN